jgi:thiazole synthase
VAKNATEKLIIADEEISSRLWLGSAMYSSPEVMLDCLKSVEPGFVTVSLRRQTAHQVADNGYWSYLQDWLQQSNTKILPNTSGCFTASEAIRLAVMARELFSTEWIKLEVIGDEYTLQPHTLELVDAAKELVTQGFKVLPYSTDDLVVCEALVDAGCPAVMPWGAPIGTGKGLLNPYQLSTLRKRLPDTPLIIDAGLGRPSQAMAAMELGFDAVLLNTAVAKSPDPKAMAESFDVGVKGGRQAYRAGVMEERQTASPSTSIAGMPFWRQEAIK